MRFLPLLILLLPLAVFSQAVPSEVRLFITWSPTNSFVPPTYEGAILPNKESVVVAALTLIDGGQIIDIKNSEIRWFLNNALVASGKGLARAMVTLGSLPVEGAHALRAEVRNYKGENRTQTLSIPFVLPEVVINAPFVNAQLPKEGAVLTGIPYFFSTKAFSELTYRWGIRDSFYDFSVDTPLKLSVSDGDVVGAPLPVQLEVVGQNIFSKTTLFLP